jgi:hypothetical protein
MFKKKVVGSAARKNKETSIYNDLTIRALGYTHVLAHHPTSAWLGGRSQPNSNAEHRG